MKDVAVTSPDNVEDPKFRPLKENTWFKLERLGFPPEDRTYFTIYSKLIEEFHGARGWGLLSPEHKEDAKFPMWTLNELKKAQHRNDCFSGGIDKEMYELDQFGDDVNIEEEEIKE